MRNHDVDLFVILDDEFFAGYEEKLENLIRTNYYNDGLSTELAEKAKDRLGRVYTLKAR